MKPIWVSDRLMRGPRPESVSDLQWFIDQGIFTIISLETGFGAFWDKITARKLLNERSMWNSYFQRPFFNFPLSNFLPPTPRQVVETIQAIQKSPGPTFLHCYSGVDRTGFLVAVWRVWEEGWGPEAAWKEAVESGMHPWFWWWKAAFLEVVK